MSHRNKPRASRSGSALMWPLLALGLVLLGAAIFLLARPADTDGIARIAVDQQRIDYGYVKFGETRAFEITVTNTGDGALRFKQKPYIEVLEGC